MPKSNAFESSIPVAKPKITTSPMTRALRIAPLTFLLVWAGLSMASAQTFTSLISFNGADGAFPQGTLIEGIDGNFYGATPYGGTENSGNIFEITPNDEATTLYSFCSQPNCADGWGPYSALVGGKNGNFYGTTFSGGKNDHGTVFEVTPTGQLTTLYNFCSQSDCTDGATPYAALVQGTNGNFYGSTYTGGSHNSGTIFEITPEGVLTTLYNFCSQLNCGDGEAPLLNNLVQGRNGNFYGTVPSGGSSGSGTVFEITPKGEFTVLYRFCSQPGCTDGATPYAGLLQGKNGNFYGTTDLGGTYNSGTIFEITAKGKLTTLYSFCSQTNCADGSGPYAGLIQGDNGNFYGTTSAGGGNGLGGTIFEITPTDKLTTLYSFCAQTGCTDGWSPIAGLLQTSARDLYGTTFQGGTYGQSACGEYGALGCGTFFRFALEPAVP
jgi:uncharacterized repeat protein (TIGR03803 family)